MKRALYYVMIVGFYLYLGFRLSPAMGLWIWPFIAFFFFGIFFFPSQWLRQSSMGRLQNLARWKCYMDVGFLSFLLSLVVARDLIFLPLLWFRPDLKDVLFGGVSSFLLIAAAFVLLKWGVWKALGGPQVKFVRIPIANLPRKLEGYRIAQISDLHVGPTIGSKYVRKVVKIVNALSPNLTVLTGDIIDGDVEHHLPAASHLAELQPAGQILCVTGNHEYYWDGPRWIREFELLGLQVLQNSRRIIEHNSHEILVAGVLDPQAVIAHPDNKPDLEAAFGSQRNSDVKILLAHQPNIAAEAAKAGFDLLLSGHTHAGQFFPFTLFIHSVQEFVRGLKACGKMWVYVNQGTGYWGPPIRLGTVTEITLLELTAKS